MRLQSESRAEGSAPQNAPKMLQTSAQMVNSTFCFVFFFKLQSLFSSYEFIQRLRGFSKGTATDTVFAIKMQGGGGGLMAPHLAG